MMTRLRASYRIIPPRLDSVVMLAIAVWALVVVGYLMIGLGAFSWPLPAIAAFLLLLGFYCASQLLPGSPTYYMELSPDGLTIGRIFGRRRWRWEEIDRFSVNLIPAQRFPFVWIKVFARDSPAWNPGFSMGGCMKLRWSDDIGEQAGELMRWFENVKAAYMKGNHSGSLPEVPKRFVGQIVSADMGY